MALSPTYSWPLPDDTDLVKDGAKAIRDLGNAVDATVSSVPTGLVHINQTTFSAVSAISLPDNTFSATYRNYRIIYSFSHSTTLDTSLRLRAGSDVTGANYNTKGILSGTSANTQINLSGQTSWMGFSGSGRGIIIIDLLQPFETTATLGFANHYANGTGNNRTVNLDHTLTNSYNSLSLLASTGNITGSVQVFGYKE